MASTSFSSWINRIDDLGISLPELSEMMLEPESEFEKWERSGAVPYSAVRFIEELEEAERDGD